jgi:phosphate transport system ATP-binding protein
MSVTGSFERRCSIEARELSLWYGDFQALKNVTADVARASITALIGPSGCGKTTLLRCINRLNERNRGVRTRGSVRVFGRNIYDVDVSLGELRKAVGMVFQRPNPLPLSIFENVAFGLRVHSSPGQLRRSAVADLVESALRDVLLWNAVKDRLHGPATSLTLEQQQKLCIARLLPLKPQIILMDEPCSALDAEATEAIERLMRSLHDAYTVLIVTHNMAQARRLSDDCMFMLMGEVVEHAPTVELFLRPQHKQTERYIEGRYG